MANPEHVALVRQGAKAIAEWRRQHPRAPLNLRECDFTGISLIEADLERAKARRAKFSRANLRGAKLNHADLREADLSGADLSQAHLLSADLSGANLDGAKLVGATLPHARLREASLRAADVSAAYLDGADMVAANLKDANLSDAWLMSARLNAANLKDTNLSRANLMWADLSRANLNGANLSKAQMRETSLNSVDLGRAVGLGTVSHGPPSGIDVNTLLRSVLGAGRKLTPEMRTFFLGASVPKELLDALPRAVARIKYYSCLISYGQPDLKFAEKLREHLKGKGIDCWLYHKDMTVGKRTWPEIEENLEEHERMVVLCSKAALRRQAVKKEIDKQIDKNPDKLIPVSLDDDWKQHGFKAEWAGRDLKTWLLDRNYADFANKPYEEALEDLLKGLRRPEAKKPRRKKG